MLKDEFKNPTLQNDYKESDVAELPVCACPTSPREQEERQGGRGRSRHQDSQVTMSTQMIEELTESRLKEMGTFKEEGSTDAEPCRALSILPFSKISLSS